MPSCKEHKRKISPIYQWTTLECVILFPNVNVELLWHVNRQSNMMPLLSKSIIKVLYYVFNPNGGILLCSVKIWRVLNSLSNNNFIFKTCNNLHVSCLHILHESSDYDVRLTTNYASFGIIADKFAVRLSL